MIFQIRSMYNPYIISVKKPNGYSISDFFNKGGYTPSKPMDSTGGDLIVIQQDYADTLANEISKFSSAALESTYTSSICLVKKVYSWPLVSLYYAAFYAAHSTIRALGISLTHIDDPTAGVINNLSQVYLGIGGTLSSGIHLIRVSNSGNLNLKNVKSKNSHIELWKNYIIVIREIQNHLLSNQPQSQIRSDLYDFLQEIVDCLGNDYKRLSSFRNDINYKMGYDVWLPRKPAKKAKTEFYSKIEKWLTADFPTTIDHKDEIGRFIRGCIRIIQLNYKILEDLEEIKTNKKLFLDDTVFKIKNDLFK